MKKLIFVATTLLVLIIFGGVLFMRNQGRSTDGTTNVSSTSYSSQNSDGSYTEQEISFESDGNRIYGRALVPETDEPVTTVIFSHGFGGNHEQEETLQETLAASGIAIYAFDFAGGTGYSPGQSEGEMTDMSVLTEVQNLEDALTIIQGQDFVDTDNIFLLGASQGGVVSSLTAVRNSGAIRGLSLLYPAFSLFDDSHDRFASESAIPETYNLMGLTVGSRYFTDIWDMDIFATISNYNGPVSIFHGTADDLVPMSYAQEAATTFPNATLSEVDGGGHSFSIADQILVADQIISFIRDNEVN